MSLDRDRIIVLRKIPFRDSDLIIHGLNAHGAKVSYLAPAALKSRRRFGGGVLEPTNFIEVIYQSTNKASPSLRRISEAQVIKEFSGLRRSYDVIQVSLSLLALIDQVGQEGEIHGAELFNLLGHALQCLSQIDLVSLARFRLHFLLKFLFQQGVLSIEPWMHPFLQKPIREHEALVLEIATIDESWILDRLMEIERLVQSYRETGAAP